MLALHMRLYAIDMLEISFTKLLRNKFVRRKKENRQEDSAYIDIIVVYTCTY